MHTFTLLVLVTLQIGKFFFWKFLKLIFFNFSGAYAQFRESTQQFIVDLHNKLRTSIAKGTYVAKGTTKAAGSNLLKMVGFRQLVTL